MLLETAVVHKYNLWYTAGSHGKMTDKRLYSLLSHLQTLLNTETFKSHHSLWRLKDSTPAAETNGVSSLASQTHSQFPTIYPAGLNGSQKKPFVMFYIS